jgi:hypothetical protein
MNCSLQNFTMLIKSGGASCLGGRVSIRGSQKPVMKETKPSFADYAGRSANVLHLRASSEQRDIWCNIGFKLNREFRVYVFLVILLSTISYALCA